MATGEPMRSMAQCGVLAFPTQTGVLTTLDAGHGATHLDGRGSPKSHGDGLPITTEHGCMNRMAGDGVPVPIISTGHRLL